ncbi:MAG: hypothetical protein ACOYNY_25615 [Caldilineaceae bacterium]|jgi:hypothetical protein
MSLTATIALTEQEQQTLQVMAHQSGTSPEDLLRAAVQRMIAEFESSPLVYHYLPTQPKRRPQSEIAKQKARERFERHFGTIIVEEVSSVDNKQIDVDLAQAYLATHEEN